jgi:uncharacterized RDD family membrane protein YckC
MDEIIEEVVPKKKEKKEKEVRKALFFQRFIAFLIDSIIVGLVASLLTTPFIDTKKEEEITNQSIEIIQKYQNQEITMEEYTSQYMASSYQLAKVSGLSSIVSVLISVAYFVVYQVFRNGQTLGKRLMKIRVVSTVGELSYNQMIFRSMIANSILVNILVFIALLFNSSQVYFYCSMIFEGIQYFIIFISVIMIINKNNGLAIHDKLVHTMVIRED